MFVSSMASHHFVFYLHDMRERCVLRCVLRCSVSCLAAANRVSGVRQDGASHVHRHNLAMVTSMVYIAPGNL